LGDIAVLVEAVVEAVEEFIFIGLIFPLEMFISPLLL
jgi:hypothetical protein